MTEIQERRRTATIGDPRRALKERLTGAVILVALVVLLVPALLTGRRPVAPPRDTSTASRSYEIDITGPSRAPTEDPAQPLPEPEPAPVPTAVTAPAVIAPATGAQGVRVAPTGLPSSGVASAGPRVLPLAPPAASASAPAAGARAAATAAGPGGVPARAPGPTGTAASVSTATPVGNAGETGAGAARPLAWAVQLGAFAGRETAAQLVATLRSKGFAAFVLEYRRDGKVLYRVRVGPEQDRERAVAIAERLNREGYRATVAPHP